MRCDLVARKRDTWRHVLRRVRARWILLPVVAQMMVRGLVLRNQPFEPGVTVPLSVGVWFVVGAVVLSVAICRRWNDVTHVVAAAAIGAPYLIYTSWAATRFGLSGIVAATLGDLLLIPWLVGALWGRLRLPLHREVL